MQPHLRATTLLGFLLAFSPLTPAGAQQAGDPAEEAVEESVEEQPRRRQSSAPT